MTDDRLILCVTPSSSLRSKDIVPKPAAAEKPDTPRTFSVEVGVDIEVNNLRSEQIWCVAQLSVPNSVGVEANEYVFWASCWVGDELMLVNAIGGVKVSVTKYEAVAANDLDGVYRLIDRYALFRFMGRGG